MTTQPTGYQTSRDYARLAELMKTRQIVCFVDYCKDCRDAASTQMLDCRRGDHTFQVSARGTAYIYASSLGEFITQCTLANLEWIVPDDLREPVQTVDEVFNTAARDLPDGWRIEVHVENGWGAVIAVRPDGSEVDMDDGIHNIEQQIKNAVALAKAEENRPGGVPEIYRCLSCGENAPEHGMICDECRMDSMND
jgi:hypothetical protein